MRYLFIVMMVVSVIWLTPAQAPASSCNVTVTNCLSEDFAYCSYDGSSFWDRIVANEDSWLTSGETNDITACSSSSSCYFIGVETDSAATYACFTFDVEGSVDCDEYACVDGDVSWHSGDSEYSCSDNTCITD